LLASFVSVITPGQFSAFASTTILAMLLLGGMDSPLGAVVGVLVLSVLPEELRVVEPVKWMAYGLILVLIMVAAPGGLAELFIKAGSKITGRPGWPWPLGRRPSSVQPPTT
jgi:branched-chain amino acid transport system permease protein